MQHIVHHPAPTGLAGFVLGSIMRAFVRLREMIAGHADLVRRIDELEKRYDRQFRAVFDAIRALISEDDAPRRRIGFHPT